MVSFQGIKCPECGGAITMDITGRNSVFCPYCGNQFSIDDGVTRVEINKNIHNYDEARLKELEYRHQKEEKIALREEKNRQAKIRILQVSGILLAISILTAIIFARTKPFVSLVIVTSVIILIATVVACYATYIVLKSRNENNDSGTKIESIWTAYFAVLIVIFFLFPLIIFLFQISLWN